MLKNMVRLEWLDKSYISLKEFKELQKSYLGEQKICQFLYYADLKILGLCF